MKCIGIYIPLILELFLDDCACYWHWLVRQICGYVVLSSVIDIPNWALKLLCRRSCANGCPRPVLVRTWREMVWNAAIHRLHAWWCRSGSFVLVPSSLHIWFTFNSLQLFTSSFYTPISLPRRGRMVGRWLCTNSLLFERFLLFFPFKIANQRPTFRSWSLLLSSRPISSMDSIQVLGQPGFSLPYSLVMFYFGSTR